MRFGLLLVVALISVATSFSQGTRLSQLEKIDDIVNQGSTVRYMPVTLFSGETDHKGQIFTTDGTQSYRPTDSIAHYLPLLDWNSQWINTCYNVDDVVRDGCWTMVANTYTCDRPSPQPFGPEFWLSAQGDAPAWTDLQIASTDLVTGVRLASDTAYYITSYRIWIPVVSPDVYYQMAIIIDPLGTPVASISQEFQPAATGWLTVDLPHELVFANTTLDIILHARNNASSSEFLGDWDYSNPQNPGAPAAGEINHANTGLGLLQVSKTDNAAVDRSVDLATLKAGDIISGVTRIWQIQSAPVDQGTYYDIEIAPQAQGSPTGVATFTFTVYATQPTDYVEIPNHWTLDSEISGLFSSTGYDPLITPDQSLYGVDVRVQEVVASEDWELLAYNCGGILGSEGGGGTADGNGMFDFNNQNGTWAVNNWSLGSGENIATMVSNQEWKFGLNNASDFFSIVPTTAFGAAINLVNSAGGYFTLTNYDGFGTTLQTDTYFNFRVPGGSTNLQMTAARSIFEKDIELDNDVYDVLNLPGTAGQVLTSNGIGLGVTWAAGGAGGSLWEADANGIIPSGGVVNIGVGIPSDAAYSIATGNRVKFAANILNNTTSMILMDNTGTGDNYIFFNGTATADDWSIGNFNALNRWGVSHGSNMNTSSDYFWISVNGNVAFPDYGDGVNVGTATFAAAFDTNGNLIEEPLGGGGTDGNGIYDIPNGGDGTVPEGAIVTVASNADPMTFFNTGWMQLNLEGQGTVSNIQANIQGLNINSPSNISLAPGLTNDVSVTGGRLSLGAGTEFFVQNGAGAVDNVLVSQGTGSYPRWGAVPAAQANAIDPSEITSSTIDITLPKILEVGQIHIHENTSAGGPAESVFANIADQIGSGSFGGSVNITNDNAIMFIAVSLTRWRQF